MEKPAYRMIKRDAIRASLCFLAMAAILAAALRNGDPVRPLAWAAAVLAGVTGLALLGRIWGEAGRLGRGLERVRGALLNVTSDPNAVLPAPDPATMPPEILSQLTALTQFHGQVLQERHGPDKRLSTVLGSLFSGVAVITGQGQVSLVNTSGRELLGRERVRVGTSIFAALDRHTVLDAVNRSRAEGKQVQAAFRRLDAVELHGRLSALPDEDGAILIFPPVELEEHRPGVDFDFGLHHLPPETEPLHLGVSLDDLPVLFLDTETTGLDAQNDRIVSIGAIRAHGTRLYNGAMIDALLDPGVPIPAVSTAIHGITDAMVRDARRFPLVCADLRKLAANSIIVGHNIPFDLTILKAECERHGCPWNHPVFIDTLRLAALLDPDLDGHDLETLADLYDLEIQGRHTALGDALVTAEIFFRMLPRFKERGHRTLEDLLRFHCTEARVIIRHQGAQGWITSQPDSLQGS